MNDLESQVTNTLHLRSHDVAEARVADILEVAIRRGRQARRRRHAFIGVVSIGLAVAGAVAAVSFPWSRGFGDGDGPAGSADATATVGTAVRPSPSGPPADALLEIREKVVPCTAVIPPPRLDEVPSDLYDSTLFPDEGILTIYYTVDGQSLEFTFNYRDDPTCRENPDLERIIKHELETTQGD